MRGPFRHLAVIAALLAFAGAARAQDKVTIMTDWSPYGVHGPLFLAQEKGWLKQAGLDVNIQDGKGSVTTIQLVGSGGVDVGFVQLASMAAAMDKGMDLTSVVCWVRAGDNGVIVPENSPIRTPQDLVGKRIVYPLGGASASLMEAFFNVAKLPRGQLNLVGVDSSALASTYVAGNVDAAITTIAYLQPMIEDKRASRTIPYSSVGLRVPSFGLTVRKTDITARKEMLAKLVPVMNRAWDYVKSGHVPEAIDAIIAARPNEKLDRTVMTNQLIGYLKLLDTPATEGKPTGWQAASDWTEAAASLQSAGLIKKALPPQDYYTNQFIAQ
jgi:NitT/TauT family transport system substrate-binding protein